MTVMTVAVVGSAAAGRTYDPPILAPDDAIRAAEEIGAELAVRGHRLVVFSGEADFIEAAIVRGYVASGKAGPKSILVRNTVTKHREGFAESDDRPELFDSRPEPNDWEVAYYRALLEVDGLVLIGGGRSTFNAGVIALARRAAIAPVAAFGGAAGRVWERLHDSPGLAVQDDVSALIAKWGTGSAAAVVAALQRQHNAALAESEQTGRHLRAESRRRTMSLVLALVFLLLGFSALPLATAWQPGTWAATVLLVGGPMFAAMSGALIRNAFDRAGGWLQAAVFGAAAGAVSGVLFVGAQLATNPDLLQGPSAARLCYFVVPVGFVAGLAFDAVLAKLRGTDVVATSPIEITAP